MITTFVKPIKIPSNNRINMVHSHSVQGKYGSKFFPSNNMGRNSLQNIETILSRRKKEARSSSLSGKSKLSKTYIIV